MKDLSFYDQVGVLFPRSVLLIGLLVLFPEFKPEFATGGVSIGDFGLFLVVAYPSKKRHVYTTRWDGTITIDVDVSGQYLVTPSRADNDYEFLLELFGRRAA